MKGILKKIVLVNLWSKSLKIDVKKLSNLIANEGSNDSLTVKLTSDHKFHKTNLFSPKFFNCLCGT